MTDTEEGFQKDIRDIGQIPIVKNLLDVICRTTGMGFAAIARVTEDRWIACSVHDDISFGMKPGDELEIKTTLCNEIRESQKTVVINHVAEDPEYADHHTPPMYGFQSYISVPIMRKDGTFFGTLCAIDPKPHVINTPGIIGMFDLFVDLIAFHLHAVEQIDTTNSTLISERSHHRKQTEDQQLFTDELEKLVAERTKELRESNEALEKMNKELQSFAYISSHDLQEPLRKIQTFSSILSEKEYDNLSEEGREYFQRLIRSAQKMRTLISDLLAYSKVDFDAGKFVVADLTLVLNDAKEDVKEETDQDVEIIAEGLGEVRIIRFQFQQLLQNLFSNSIKFAHPGRKLVISITGTVVEDSPLRNEQTPEGTQYFHLRVSDNGIGFEQQYNERIFEIFQRLHDVKEFQGTGIGLAIVKKIIENHQGHITASGKTGEGASFDIYLHVI